MLLSHKPNVVHRNLYSLKISLNKYSFEPGIKIYQVKEKDNLLLVPENLLKKRHAKSLLSPKPYITIKNGSGVKVCISPNAGYKPGDKFYQVKINECVLLIKEENFNLSDWV